MRVLVCGGRDYGDLASLKSDRANPLWPQREREYLNVQRFLTQLFFDRAERTEEDDVGNYLFLGTIIEGGARGADAAAADFAAVEWLTLEEYPADWDKYGKRAGYIRNAEMLKKGKPDVVVAFPGGSGTEMMVKLAEKAGVEVIKVGW